MNREAEEEENDARVAFDVFCRALFKNPQFIIRTVQYIIGQTTLPGFRQKWRPTLVGLPSSNNNNKHHSTTNTQGRDPVFGSVVPQNLTTEAMDDVMRMISKNIIQKTLQNRAQAVQLDVDLTMLNLIQRVSPIVADAITTIDEMVMPEVAIFVIESLVSILDIRWMFCRTPLSEHANGNAWLRWWSHSFLGIPQSLMNGDPLFAVSLGPLGRHAKKIFAQAAVRPHNGVSTPLYYENCKYNGIASKQYNGWYWMLTYLMQIGRLVANSHTDNTLESFERFLVFRRWFTETLSVVAFVATKNIRFMQRASVEFGETAALHDDDDAIDFLKVSSAATMYKTMQSKKWIYLHDQQRRDAVVPLEKRELSHASASLYQQWKTRVVLAFWTKNIVSPLIDAHKLYTQTNIVGKFF